MAYHRGGHAGAVAVSYSTNAMPVTPLSPSRRYSSGSSGANTSGITSSSSSAKLSSYRTSGSFDRPSYYSSSSSTSTSGYGTSHRSTYSSEYRRFCSPSRSLSVSSSSFSDTGTGAGGNNVGGATSITQTGRYSRERNSEARETLGSLATSAADLYAKYSPANYVPNITASNERNGVAKSSSTSSINGYSNSTGQNTSGQIFGGNSSNAKIISYTPNNESTSGTSSYTVNNIQGRPPRAARRSPVNATTTLQINNHDKLHQLQSDGQTTTETEEEAAVSYDERIDDDSSSVSKSLTISTEDRPVPEDNTRCCSNGVFERTETPLGLNSEDSEEEDGDESDQAKGGFVTRTGTNLNGDNSLPSTSRRGDTYAGTGNASNANGSNGIGNSSFQTAITHQNVYRGGINDQIESSPTIRAPRNRLQTPRDERCGLNGLRNIGNTCFMNSVIQCLSNTRPLLEYLVNEQYLADINTSTSGMKGALIKAFSQVIQELWEVGSDHVVNTTSLKSQIQRFAPRFMGYSQQDAQEFLRYLLEGLHEDVNRVTVKPQPIHTDIPEHYSDSQKAAESWKRYLRNEDSTIVDVFVGQLRSSLHCTSCGHVSVTLDPFWDLSLPIPTRSGTVKLNQCLEHFTKEEVLDGDEKPTCSKCQTRRKCTKSFSIQKFPKILVIHLKRFSPMERFRGKLNTLVDFPLTGLDLGAFSAPRVAGCTYNLYGVANHSGTTYSGHYTAYCKHPYSGEWHEYNDSRVSSIASRSVVSSEGYVLFYEQQPHSSNL